MTAQLIQEKQGIFLLKVRPPGPLTKYRQNMFKTVLITTDDIYFTFTLNIFPYCKINVFIYLTMKRQLSILHLQDFQPPF